MHGAFVDSWHSFADRIGNPRGPVFPHAQGQILKHKQAHKQQTHLSTVWRAQKLSQHFSSRKTVCQWSDSVKALKCVAERSKVVSQMVTFHHLNLKKKPNKQKPNINHLLGFRNNS